MYHRKTIALLCRIPAALLLAVAVACLALPALPVSAAGEEEFVDVGLVIFDAGIPADESTHSKLGIFPEIRKAEAKYMPVMLREILVNSGDWGVVRVLPEPLDSSELLVTGTIQHSDGQRLELHIEARDAAGAQWLDRVYTGTTTPADYPVKVPGDPFMQVYRQIAADLLAVRRQMSAGQLADLRQIALMRYAASLAPQVFGDYLATTSEGRYTLVRLPAEDDPMLARVIRIRNQEYLFIDTVDEQYANLAEQMAPTYNLWRQYGAEQAEYRDEYQARVSSRDSQGRRGSFVALEQTYNAYKWSKIHEQDLDELALGFNNEVAPTVMEVSGTVFKLTGSLDSQYSEWRAILQCIFALETGLPPAA
ncbi:MAG: hypothetical protein KDI17_10820 [Halioglobus sp.]|nr:hypothetical protein [Halioglobus sp.]